MPTSQHATTNNLRLHCTEAGEGDSVLLVRGFRISSHLYRNALPELARTHRAIAIDLPGYGLSDKPLGPKYNFAFFENILEDFCDAPGILHTHLIARDLVVGLF